MNSKKLANENYIVNSKYLAKALAFIGFRYETRVQHNNMCYVFTDSERLRECIDTMVLMQKKTRGN